MERVAWATSVSLLLLFFSLQGMPATAHSTSSTVSRQTATTDFIKSSCSATHYPALCIQSLSVYANTIKRSPRLMALTAISVSLAQAHTAAAFISKLSSPKGMSPRDYAAVKDCIKNVNNIVDRLSQSVREMRRMGRTGSGSFQLYKGRVVNVARVTSNALALVNRCAQKQNSSFKNP